MHTKQCFRHPSLFFVQNGSNIRHTYVLSMISGTVFEDDNTFARTSGKPKKNHQDIRVGRPYQYVSLRCLFRMKGDERFNFFVSTLEAPRRTVLRTDGVLLGKYDIINPIINLKDSYFEPAVGSPPNFARMCGYRPY